MKTGNDHIDAAADALVAVLQYQFPDQAERIGRAGIVVQFDNGGFIQLRTMEGEPAAAAPAEVMPAPAPAAMEAPGAAVVDVAEAAAAVAAPAAPVVPPEAPAP